MELQTVRHLLDNTKGVAPNVGKKHLMQPLFSSYPSGKVLDQAFFKRLAGVSGHCPESPRARGEIFTWSKLYSCCRKGRFINEKAF